MGGRCATYQEFLTVLVNTPCNKILAVRWINAYICKTTALSASIASKCHYKLLDIKDISQYNSKISNGERKVVYAARNGKFEAGKSNGWVEEEFATQQAVQALDELTEQALQAVKNGEKSAIYYLMYKYRFDETTLAQATGFRKWQVRRHFRPEVFAKLSEKTLGRYATVFSLSLNELFITTENIK